MKLIVAQSALDDLRDIMGHYRVQGVPDVGLRLVREILDRVEILSSHPDAGWIVPEFEQASIRELIFPPFRLVYLRGVDELHLVRVWRSERLLHLPPAEVE